MPRQARLDIPDALHHIMVRGISKADIFDDGQDRALFLERLTKLGLSSAEIARHVGRNTSSIIRSIQRAERSRGHFGDVVSNYVLNLTRER